eukprot:Hpha_TRINITY_DN2137_c0_g2::TRINITY_DN2137_c0_g2_i1::g.42250::m.42250
MVRAGLVVVCFALVVAGYTNNEEAEAHVPVDPSFKMAEQYVMAQDEQVERQMTQYYENLKEEKRGQFRRRQRDHSDMQTLHSRQRQEIWELLEAEMLLVWIVFGIPFALALLHLMKKRQI